MSKRVDLPRSSDDTVIPVAALKDGGSHAITSSAASARNSVAFDAGEQIVSVYATQAVFIKFGDATVEAAATDHYFPAGVYYDFFKPAGCTHLAVIQATAGGTVYVSEKWSGQS